MHERPTDVGARACLCVCVLSSKSLVLFVLLESRNERSSLPLPCNRPALCSASLRMCAESVSKVSEQSRIPEH